MLYNLSGGVLRALGDSKTPVYYLVLASVINIVLDIGVHCVLRHGRERVRRLRRLCPSWWRALAA